MLTGNIHVRDFCNGVESGTQARRLFHVPPVPSFFIIFTLKLPHMRFAVPIVIPLFILEDLLESTATAIRIVGFFVPSLRRKVKRSMRNLKDVFPCSEDFDITVALDVAFKLVRGLRSYGRFTLLEVSEGSSGVSIAVRFV